MVRSNANLDEKWAERIWDPRSATEGDSEENPRAVCICVVPESLRCSKREAFIPQFVGLGPYHNLSPDLILTKERKLAAAKRVLKDLLSDSMNLIQQRIISKFGSHTQTFYHPDFKSTNNDHTLSFIDDTLSLLLAVDGLFLLAFIRLLTSSSSTAGGDLDDAEFSNFLTGKIRMLLFNAAGVELTKNVLIREVFMLENQIPSLVLEQITGSAQGLGLGSHVVTFCKNHCPVLNLEELPNVDYVHLLDLMYHLIVPRAQSPPQPQEPEARPEAPLETESNDDEPQPEPGIGQYFPSIFGGGEWELIIVPLMFICVIPYIVVALIHLIIVNPFLPDPKPEPHPAEPDSETEPQSEPELEPETEPQQEPELEPETETQQDPELEPETQPQSEPELEPETEAQQEPELEPETEPQPEPESEFQLFGSWESFGYVLVAEVFLPGYFIYLVAKLLLWVICSLIYRPIKRVFSYLFGLVKRAFRRRNFNSAFRWSHEALKNMGSRVNYPLVGSLTQAVAGLEELTQEQQSTDWDEGAPLAERIPPAKKLRSAGIYFQPAKSGAISSIDFVEESCIFYLPCIRMGVNSEVIIRNLVAYETLIKSDTPLVFTRYIELMRAIIVTSEDVKILVDSQIITSELTNQAVADFFNGMSNSIRPTKTEELDKVIHKVKSKFDSTRKRNWAVIKHMSKTFFAVMGGLLLLAFTGLQTYCSFFGCSRTSKLGQLPENGEYYGRNNYFISSM
ncbi:putative UPF0481 protein [Glycine soja]|nr:hypothetical protein JHK86_056918 [Glycine max]